VDYEDNDSDSDIPVRVAFCKVMFGWNGGEFSETGLPLASEEEVRALCDRAYDCGACTALGTWLASLAAQGWTWGWECDKCVKDSRSVDAARGVRRVPQALYQAGRRRDRLPGDPEYDPDLPGLEGCTTCGWESSFLQLVLRKENP
jgi:hypothetical protein